jgi:kynurenine formamidase
MCSPEVAKVVSERIAREGLPQVTRRGLLKAGGLGAAAAALGGFVPRVAAQEMSGGYSVVDLSHVFGENMPTYTPGEGPTREDFVTVEANGFFIQYWTLYEHSGTHSDFPAHFIADGATVDSYDPGLLLAPAVVINIAEKAAENPDAMVEPADLEAWEAANGTIPEGAVVLMNSGWAARWPNEEYRNADADGVQHYPGFSGEAVTWLIEERGINGIGVDTLSLDPGNSATFDAHYATLGAGKYGLENVANLDAIEGVAGAMIVVGIPRWEASGGGPTRVLALVPSM